MIQLKFSETEDTAEYVKQGTRTLTVTTGSKKKSTIYVFT